MTVITARPRWLRKPVGTFTAIHSIWILVSSLVLVMTLLSFQVEKITLDFTAQSTVHTDARPMIVPQRSGGLENSKFFIQMEQTTSTQKKHTFLNLNTPQFVCIYFDTRVSAKIFLVSKKSTSLPNKDSIRGGIGHSLQWNQGEIVWYDRIYCIQQFPVLILIKPNKEIKEIQNLHFVTVVM